MRPIQLGTPAALRRRTPRSSIASVLRSPIWVAAPLTMAVVAMGPISQQGLPTTVPGIPPPSVVDPIEDPPPSSTCYIREPQSTSSCCDVVDPFETLQCGPNKVCHIVRAGRDDAIFHLLPSASGWSEGSFPEGQPSAECEWFPPRCVQDSMGYNCSYIPVLHRTGCWSWGKPEGPPNCQ